MHSPSQLFRITSKIVSLARRGRIECARKRFDEMLHKDSIAWNAMLTSYSLLGLHQDALSLLHCMRITGHKPDHFSFTATLSASAGLCKLYYGRKIHAQVIVFGYLSFLPVNNSLIDMYGKCLCPSSASRVFEEMGMHNEVSWCSLLFACVNSNQFGIAYKLFYTMPNRVDFAWNIMISGYARYGEVELCLGFFKKMQQNSCKPDQWTFSALMSACADLVDLFCGRTLHAYIVKSGWNSAVVNNSILSFYAKLNCGDDAIKVFESAENLTQISWNVMIDAHMKMGDIHKALLAFQHAPVKNVISFTSMIAGYARNGQGEQALSLFISMMRNNLRPDDFTFGAILHACSSLAVIGYGKMVHGCIIRHGFCDYVYVGNGLVNMYAKGGDIKGSSCSFADIPDKDLVSWNAMLFGFGLHGQASDAFRLYEEMLSSGIKPDKVTFIGLLMTCSHSGLIEEGQMLFKSMECVHGLCHEMDHVACMIDMLGRGGYLTEARELTKIYQEMDMKTESFETLLGACFAHGNVEIGMQLGEDLKILEPYREISYVMLSNLYCSGGHWKEAQLVRKTMVDREVKKLPGYSWIEIGNKMTSFVAGDLSHPCWEELGKVLCFLEFEMRNPCFIGLGS